jgi:MYXO-CTERM domain-containing protein
VALLLLLVGSALALPAFPGVVTDQLVAACDPPCSVCHQGAPGWGTATSDFAMALKDRGFATSEGTLRDALDTMAADRVDSDGDGTIDVDELVAGVDPNPNGVAFCGQLTPTYGCLSSAGARPGAAGAAAAALGLLGLAALRRRRAT